MTAQAVVGQALGVRHHAEDGLGLVEDASNVVLRAVDVGGLGDFSVGLAIAERDAAFVLQRPQCRIVGEVVALVVSHRNADHVARLVALGEGAARILDLQMHVAADELEVAVAHQCAGQESGFGENLEAVADSQNAHALFGFALHIAHDGRVGGHGATAQVVAIRETAGHDDEIQVRQFRIPVPDHLRGSAHAVFEGDGDVAVAVGPGEDDNSSLHGLI